MIKCNEMMKLSDKLCMWIHIKHRTETQRQNELIK